MPPPHATHGSDWLGAVNACPPVMTRFAILTSLPLCGGRRMTSKMRNPPSDLTCGRFFPVTKPSICTASTMGGSAEPRTVTESLLASNAASFHSMLSGKLFTFAVWFARSMHSRRFRQGRFVAGSLPGL